MAPDSVTLTVLVIHGGVDLHPAILLLAALAILAFLYLLLRWFRRGKPAVTRPDEEVPEALEETVQEPLQPPMPPPG